MAHSKDQLCVALLQELLPHLHLRWKGYRKVRKQVCHKVWNRLSQLKIYHIRDYKHYLAQNPNEWELLRQFCTITISRFYRDMEVFDTIRNEIFPKWKSKGKSFFDSWSVGCASGEEPYTLNLIWKLEHPSHTKLNILATSNDRYTLNRAERACYNAGSLKDLPGKWINKAFKQDKGSYCLKPSLKEGISFQKQDILEKLPDSSFDMILCRYLVFTYFDEDLQEHFLTEFLSRLRLGGYLIIGKHESIVADRFSIQKKAPCIYQKTGKGKVNF